MTSSIPNDVDKDRGGKPPRPPNCFILYRSDKVEEIRAKQSLSTEKMQKDISKLVAGMSSSMSSGSTNMSGAVIYLALLIYFGHYSLNRTVEVRTTIY